MRGPRVHNLYKVLGIASTADDQRIKSAFRRRALRVHPDLNPGSKYADERFRELMQAYQVLRDAEARAAYDAHLTRQRSESRRRFMQSAAVMVATFTLTVTSIFAVGLQGLNVHSETWQIATTWLTSVKVEAPSGEASEGTPSATTVVARTPSTGTGPAAAAHPSSAPLKAAARERGRKAKAEAALSTQEKVASAVGDDPAKP
jgi:curved DNA-binding protein CbpA